MASPACRSIHAGHPESSRASSRATSSSSLVCSSDDPASFDVDRSRSDDADVVDSRLRLCAFLGWTWFSAGASTVSAHAAAAAFATVDDALSWLDELQDSSPHESPPRSCADDGRPSLLVRAWCADGGGWGGAASESMSSERTWLPPVDAYLNGLAFLADVLVATRSRRRSASSTSRLDLANRSPRPVKVVTASTGSAANHRAPPRPEWLES